MSRIQARSASSAGNVTLKMLPAFMPASVAAQQSTRWNSGMLFCFSERRCSVSVLIGIILLSVSVHTTRDGAV